MEIHCCIPWEYGLREITGQHSGYGHTLKMLDRNIVNNCCYHIFLVTAILCMYTTLSSGVGFSALISDVKCVLMCIVTYHDFTDEMYMVRCSCL